MEGSFSLAGKRLLLCEDEGITVLQLRKALQRLGIEVIGIAATGEEAVEHALAHRPDIILMDWQMPKMDGLEAAKHILAAYPVCILLMTGYSDARYETEALAAGVHGFVIKPLTSGDLPTLLETAFLTFCQAASCPKRPPEYKG